MSEEEPKEINPEIAPINGRQILDIISSKDFLERLRESSQSTQVKGVETGFEIFYPGRGRPEIKFGQIQTGDYHSLSSRDYSSLYGMEENNLLPFSIIDLHFHPTRPTEDILIPSFGGEGDLWVLNVVKDNIPFRDGAKIIAPPLMMIGQVDIAGDYRLLILQEQYRGFFDTETSYTPETIKQLEKNLKRCQNQAEVLNVLQDFNYQAEIIEISKEGKITAADRAKIMKFGVVPGIISGNKDDESFSREERLDFLKYKVEQTQWEEPEAVPEHWFVAAFSSEERKKIISVLNNCRIDITDLGEEEDVAALKMMVKIIDKYGDDFDFNFLKRSGWEYFVSFATHCNDSSHFSRQTRKLDNVIKTSKKVWQESIGDKDNQELLERLREELTIYEPQFKDKAICGVFSGSAAHVELKESLGFDFVVADEGQIDSRLEEVETEIPEFINDRRLGVITTIDLDEIQRRLKSINQGRWIKSEGEGPLYEGNVYAMALDFKEILTGELVELPGAKHEEVRQKIEEMKEKVLAEAQRNVLFRAVLSFVIEDSARRLKK